MMVPVCLWAAGCSKIAWEFDYTEAETKARLAQKDLLLYFRRWSSPQCGQIEGNWLHKSAAVANALKNKVNCWLEWDFVQEIARKYRLKDCPAFVLIRPDGHGDKVTGVITEEQFLGFIERAESPPPSGPTNGQPPPQRTPAARR